MLQADRSVERRMAELAARAAHTGIPQVAWFLSPAEQAQAEICARQADVYVLFQGGTPDAERRVAAFSPDEWAGPWPVVCVAFTWHAKYGAPGHRDLLGSILGLGIGREKVGDLIVQAGKAYAFVLRDMGAFIAASLDRVGHTPVRATVLADWPEDIHPAATAQETRVTVASPRLDALLGAIWNLSRTKAGALVAAGRVQVNHLPEMKPDRPLTPGAVISVRGLGRARVQTIGSATRKGRIPVTLLRY